MKAIVVANVEQQKEIESKDINSDVALIFERNLSEIKTNDAYDILFYLHEEIDIDLKKIIEKPVFINSVIETLGQKNLPKNFSRINGWPGFLERPIWEVATNDMNTAGKVFKELHWKIVFVKDEPGFVTARVISMIINEAFFALSEKISTKEEIDLAMKLGTNYPYGPFEWANRIGLQNIYLLLESLSADDKRYIVATLLREKYFEFVSLGKN